jgi:periplasmic protein TonB
MKAEEILKSQWLDILFENRNKEYGAYTLRKLYNVRLLKAVASALVFSLLLFLLLQNVKKKTAALLFDNGTEFDISEAIAEKKIPEKIPEPMKQAPKPPKSFIYVVPQFVKDAQPVIEAPDDNDNAAVSNVSHPDGPPVGPIQPEITPVTPDPGPAIQPDPPVVTKEPEIYFYNSVEILPEYPGGKEKRDAFLQQHLGDYVTDEGVVKKAYVQFIVEKDGTLSGIQVINGEDEDFNRKVIRAFSKMPRWKPGLQNGHYVKVQYQLPVQLIPAE